MKKLPLLFGLALVGIALGGCELYLGKEKPSDSPPGTRPPGDTCASNADCAPGCFCDAPAGAGAESGGACQEAGFCDKNEQCAAGFHCDDRKSCVPDPTCAAATDCSQDGSSVCDNGACEATSCIAPAAGTCSNPVAVCDEGSVATVYKGCYTGGCTVITSCNDEATCNQFQHEADCLRRTADCATAYTGHNCHNTSGQSCTQNSAGCTCDQFTFAGCAARGPSERAVMQDQFGHSYEVSAVAN